MQHTVYVIAQAAHSHDRRMYSFEFFKQPNAALKELFFDEILKSILRCEFVDKNGPDALVPDELKAATINGVSWDAPEPPAPPIFIDYTQLTADERRVISDMSANWKKGKQVFMQEEFVKKDQSK